MPPAAIDRGVAASQLDDKLTLTLCFAKIYHLKALLAVGWFGRFQPIDAAALVLPEGAPR